MDKKLEPAILRSAMCISDGFLFILGSFCRPEAPFVPPEALLNRPNVTPK